MLTHEQKENSMHPCQNLNNQHEDEGDSFLDRDNSGDEAWCRPGRNGDPLIRDKRIPTKETAQDTASSE